MRVYFVLYSFIVLLASCAQNSGPANDSSSSDNEIRKEVMSIAENYAASQLKVSTRTVIGNGIVILSDKQKRYFIDPGKILTGLIDDDSTKDAIITITSFHGEELDMIEHLVILNTNGKLMLLKTIESDMKIIQFQNRIITGELPTHPRSSPLYNCASCQAIVKYKFIKGDLIKIE